jgi:hypothetical protein
MTIEIAQDAADLCTQFLKPPMGLTYEKTLMPFILLSKKRYVGMLYEDDPNKGKLKYRKGFLKNFLIILSLLRSAEIRHQFKAS